jgi:hypothetical protein
MPIIRQEADDPISEGDGASRRRRGLDQLVDRSGRNALNVGLLDDGGERLLGHAPGFEEAGKVGTLAEFRDPQLDRAGACLPGPVTIAVALRQPLDALLAVGGPGQLADLQLHQPLGGEPDHLPQ